MEKEVTSEKIIKSNPLVKSFINECDKIIDILNNPDLLEKERSKWVNYKI